MSMRRIYHADSNKIDGYRYILGGCIDRCSNVITCWFNFWGKGVIAIDFPLEEVIYNEDGRGENCNGNGQQGNGNCNISQRIRKRSTHQELNRLINNI